MFILSETFFDLIDEDIGYPYTFNSDIVTAVSLAIGNLITTSRWTNFSLFSYEKEGWSEKFIDFREEISNLSFSSEQLVTVRHQEAGR